MHLADRSCSALNSAQPELFVERGGTTERRTEQMQMVAFPATDALARGGMYMTELSDVDPDVFIRGAIEAGARAGVEALDPDQRLVFLISEVEVLCDMEGIDTFLDRYRPRWMAETATAFAAIGATQIAAALGAITLDTPPDDPLLDRANELIVNRAGYDYEAIRRAIEGRLAGRIV
jgi:hypothetical protein